MPYLKPFIFSFLCFSSLTASTAPSFTFSEKEGLKPLIEQDLKIEKKSLREKADSNPENSVLIQKDLKAQIIKKTKSSSDPSPIKNFKNKIPNQKTNSETSIKIQTEIITEKNNLFEKKSTEESLLSSPLQPESEDLSAPAEKATQDSISETFAPQKEKSSFLKSNGPHSFFKDLSWVFQKKETKHKLAVVPIYSYDKTENSRFGLRLFSFSPETKGYYLALSGAKYWPKNYYSSSLTYKSKRNNVFRSELSFIYDDHYEIHYGSLNRFQGMKAPIDEAQKLESHRFMIDYNLFYQEKEKPFYFGAGGRAFFRQERKLLQNNESLFPSEYFIFLRAFTGMDTRDNWKYPRKGVFHQASLGCKASLVSSSAYCQTHGDLRFYISPPEEAPAPDFIKNSVFSLRAFYGSSLINSASYATKYSLGGESFFQQLDALRGFKNRRFLGDKIYLGQSELRTPVWKEYIILALFLEAGETAQLGESFGSFVTNYGGGVRIGWPKDSGMKLRFDYSAGRDRQNKKNTDFIISFLQAF